jgi:hypothetical protein
MTMPNITLAMDEELLAAARALAKAEGTTLNAMVRRLVSEAIGQKAQREAARVRLLEKMDKSTARIPKGYKFNRAEIYESKSVSGHKRTDLRNRRKAV